MCDLSPKETYNLTREEKTYIRETSIEPQSYKIKHLSAA